MQISNLMWINIREGIEAGLLGIPLLILCIGNILIYIDNISKKKIRISPSKNSCKTSIASSRIPIEKFTITEIILIPLLFLLSIWLTYHSYKTIRDALKLRDNPALMSKVKIHKSRSRRNSCKCLYFTLEDEHTTIVR